MTKEEVKEFTCGIMTHSCFNKRYVCDQCGRFLYSRSCKKFCGETRRAVQIESIVKHFTNLDRENNFAVFFRKQEKSEVDKILNSMDFERDIKMSNI